ncbi:hypothetical protein JVT61DRAFT_12141 [Boletus reticuloceps]|uniref:Uncharacterized protein n=1 Tax=Boletus reticuloceps TaxID=495285 RepID=A0A8I2YEF3_9AGAM|nr:hypothetical protein JVT61DRAFT_12141 [Boletus reticuloceps]
MNNDFIIPTGNILKVLSSLTPHTLPTLSFSLQTKAKIKFSLDHAWADFMLKKYCGVIKEFHIFCDKENITTCRCLPTDEHLLCAFMASHVGSLTSDTVQSYMAAIKA